VPSITVPPRTTSSLMMYVLSPQSWTYPFRLSERHSISDTLNVML